MGKPYECGSHWEENALEGNKGLLELHYVVLYIVHIKLYDFDDNKKSKRNISHKHQYIEVIKK